MKNLKKRLCAFALTAGMAVSMAACSSPKADPSPSPEIVADLSRDILDFSAGLKANDTMLTVNGIAVPADLYLYFLAVNCTYLEQMYQADIAKNADSLKADSKTVTAYYKLLEAKCQELGCTLTDQQRTELNETLMAEGPEIYEQRKTMNGLSDSTMEFVYAINYYYENVLNATIGQPTEEDLNNFVYQTRHILLKTVDTTKEPEKQADGTFTYPALDEKTVAEKKALAEDLLAQLKSSEDPSTLFTDLMKKHSEDEGLQAQPNGYTATPGQMVPAYESAAMALGFGEISGIVESDYGYHIIIRDKVPELTKHTQNWRDYQMGKQVDQWLADADIQTTEAFDNLNVADFYVKFTVYQKALGEKYAPSPSPTPSPSPSQDPQSTEPPTEAGDKK